MKKIKRLLCAFLSACILSVLILSPTVVSAESISSLQQQLQELETQNQEYQKILDQTQSDIDEKEKYIDTLVSKIDVLGKKIALTSDSIEQINDDIESKQEAIDKSNDEIDAQVEVLCGRLRTIYMAGSASDLEIIFGAKDFSDFLDKLKLIETFTNYDKNLIEEINATLNDVTEQKEELEADKIELEKQQAALQSDEDELNELLEENKATLDELYTASEDTQKAMEQAALESEEIENKIQEYYKELAKSAGISSDLKVSASGFTWPCPGNYTLTSVWNEDRITYNHGAIDIGASTGSTVVAAYKGTVVAVYNDCPHNWGKTVSCGCGGGYGNYVMIDHGDGKLTIYGHLTYASVELGETVETGQTIGYVGSTGNSTGPHLHFECRLNGVKYNPMLEFEE